MLEDETIAATKIPSTKAVKSLILRLRSSDFVKYNLIFFIGSLGVGVLNYIYQLVVARLLGPADYSIVAAMLSLTYILFIPASPVATVAMKYASLYQADKKHNEIKGFLFTLTLYLIPLSLVLFLGVVLLSRYLADFLNTGSSLPVVLIGMTIILSFVAPLNKGVLQGLKRFSGLTIIMGIEAIGKVIFAGVLIMLGFGANGAIIAVFLGMLIGYLASMVPLKDYLGPGRITTSLNKLAGYSGAVFATGLGIMVLMNTDILLVKHFFPADQAGVYAAASTVGKIIFFITMPIAGVMFPMVSELHEKDEQHTHLVSRSLVLVLGISAAILLVYAFCPGFVISILYGAKFVSAANYLLWLGIFGMLLSLTGFFTNYFLSIDRKMFIPALLGASLLMPVLIVLFHGSLIQVAIMAVLTLILLVSVLAVLCLRDLQYSK